MILKILAYSLLFYFIVFRLGGFLFRSLLWLMGGQPAQKQFFGQAQPRRNQAYTARRPEGSITVDYVPENRQDRHKSRNYTDGDFVDYEEVK